MASEHERSNQMTLLERNITQNTSGLTEIPDFEKSAFCGVFTILRHRIQIFLTTLTLNNFTNPSSYVLILIPNEYTQSGNVGSWDDHRILSDISDLSDFFIFPKIRFFGPFLNDFDLIGPEIKIQHV